MDRKKVLRSLISLLLLAAVVTVIIVSQNRDPSNPHPKDKQVWINGPKGHGYVVNRNQQPWKQCYTCHIKKGYGGESYCIACHEKSGVKVNIPQKP